MSPRRRALPPGVEGGWRILCACGGPEGPPLCGIPPVWVTDYPALVCPPGWTEVAEGFLSPRHRVELRAREVLAEIIPADEAEELAHREARRRAEIEARARAAEVKAERDAALLAAREARRIAREAALADQATREVARSSEAALASTRADREREMAALIRRDLGRGPVARSDAENAVLAALPEEGAGVRARVVRMIMEGG